MIREDFLQQNSCDPVDAYSPPEKKHMILKSIVIFYENGKKAISKGIPVSKIRELSSRVLIARMRYYTFEELKDKIYQVVIETISREFEEILRR